MPPDDVTFREMVESDIPAGLALCRASHWNQVARDWRWFLTWDSHGALVAVRDTRVIGTVVTVRYGDARTSAAAPIGAPDARGAPDAQGAPDARGETSAAAPAPARFAWVAMMLVDPAERGRGVGRALLTRGLALLDDVATVRLDATPAGEPLYRTLGFVEESRFTRLQRAPVVGNTRAWSADARAAGGHLANVDSGAFANGEPNEAAAVPETKNARATRQASAPRAAPEIGSAPGAPSRGEATADVRPVRPADWSAIAALDARVFAADRRRMLEWLHVGAPEYAWVATTGAARADASRAVDPGGATHEPSLSLAGGSADAATRGVRDVIDRRAAVDPADGSSIAHTARRDAGGRVVGYVFGRRGHNFDHIGPVVADRVETAARLVGACLAAHPERACIVDVPVDQAEWRRWLAGAGFVEQRPFLRMSRGQPPPAGDPASLFATLGPEFG